MDTENNTAAWARLDVELGMGPRLFEDVMKLRLQHVRPTAACVQRLKAKIHTLRASWHQVIFGVT